MKYTKADKRQNPFKLITLWRGRAYLLGANKPLSVITLSIMPLVIVVLSELKTIFWPKLKNPIGIVSIVGLPSVQRLQEIKRPPLTKCPGTAI